jgi:hypothetical protein
MLMQKSDCRLFNCAGCHAEVIICRPCDRGNIYCSSVCAALARKKYMKKAGDIYQGTKEGMHMHAERQKRYRKRLKDKQLKIVTQQGSQEAHVSDLLPMKINNAMLQHHSSLAVCSNSYCCHFCGANCYKTQRNTETNDIKQTERHKSRPFGPKVSTGIHE